MSKAGEIKFEELEKLGQGQKLPVRTDDQYLAILSDAKKLNAVVEKEGSAFFGQLLGRLVISGDLKKRVDEILAGRKKG